jgi:uncharacterized OsmC-like protein
MRTTSSVVRERQAVLRTAFTEQPSQAVTEKWARTDAPPGDPFHGVVEVGKGYHTFVKYGIDRAVGGLHDAPNPGDLLCAALAACADGTIRMIADLVGVQLEALSVVATGRLDVRGTLGMDPSVRVGFEQLSCQVSITPAEGSEPERVRMVLAAAERACVNLDTLRRGATVELAVVPSR